MTEQFKYPETLEECLVLQAHFIGIPKITKKNYLEFYRRGKILQIIGVGFWMGGSMPTLDDVRQHINLETNAMKLDPKQWMYSIQKLLTDLTNTLMENETSVNVESTVLHDV